ncbi:PHP domain-containing protein [Fuchsiella alkaliacetigena]|uniref:PHP domain-containing protein n=1 Tax=Fuchsiella alkaliacetigena TaxID=957042 RepID=UPI00200A68C4|nr:PHP domain-containing protein [Fuchsiella alkaliacetigena]MCK8824850.1 PHP domain-containing protein [Fuchsiella alkaliacetigena]
MELIGDYHVHTKYGHGQGEVKDIIATAERRGLQELAITEHGPSSWTLIKLGVKSLKELLEIKEQIQRYSQEYSDLKVLSGVEANIISSDGELDVPESLIAELDLLLVGLHLWIKPPHWRAAKDLIFDNTIGYRLGLKSKDEIRYNNTRALLAAIERYEVDIITHPGFQLDIDTVELAKKCKEENVLLEINNKHDQLNTDFINTAAQTGVKFVVNSDAHRPEGVGRVDSAFQLIREAELDLGQVANVVLK